MKKKQQMIGDRKIFSLIVCSSVVEKNGTSVVGKRLCLVQQSCDI